jgi:glutaredoxin
VRRRDARLRLEALRAGRGPKPQPVKKEAAPVMVYFEKDRNARLLGRIEDTLKAREIPYTLLDVAGDDTTKNFVMRTARCKDDELPVVFVAGEPVGGYNDLVAWEVSGKLQKAVFGA